MSFTQDNRLMSISTPLGRDVLLLTGFTGTEEISRMFTYSLEFTSEDNNIAPMDIIGKNVTVSLSLENDQTRYFNGVISHFTQTRVGGEDDQVLHNSTYTATMVPWLWFLNRGVNSRIYQNKDVKQIIEQVFERWQSKDCNMSGLTGSYQPREYCVQYRETDFNFICRLLEEEGIFFYFAHEDGKHTLILGDSIQEHKPCPVQDVVHCQLTGGAALLTEGVIRGMGWNQEIRFGKYTLNDYNFMTPSTNLKVEVGEQQRSGPDEREYYLYPARYNTRSEGERLVNLRMQAEEARIMTMHGSGNCKTLTSGYRFTLQDHPRADLNGKSYLVTSVSHLVRQPIGGAGEGTTGNYSNRFTCIPIDVPFRPVLNTPRPVIQGIHTAIVTGPDGEEIYTDQHGRVKVRFHWDREDNRNEESSCWARVAQIWAGQGWGAVWIPRIGHEVIVSFIEGDPDRPVVTGCVYNAHQTPPYTLPANATQSGIKTRSSKGGSDANFNEIRFEDKLGSEQIKVHAEKNMDTSVEANDTLDVGGDRTVHVKGHFKENIDTGEERQVDAGAKETINGGMMQIITGGETRNVSGGVNETIEGGENRTVDGGINELVLGREFRTIQGDQDETITGSLNQTAVSGMNIMTPGSITITAASGVTINSPAGYSVVAPGGNTTVDSWFTKIGGKDEDLFAVQTAILSMQTTIAGMSTAMQATKIDVTGIALERCGVKSANEPLTFKQASTKLKSGAIGLYMYTLTLID